LSHESQQSAVASPHAACPPTACPSVAASRGLPTFAFVMGRDGGPELVIRGEHPWLVSSRQAMPVLPRRRHEGSEPVEELKWGKLDDAADARPRGLPPACRAHSVGRLVWGEHVADASDAAVFAAVHGEPFQHEGRTGTVSQQVLETFKVARYVAVDERNAHAGVRKQRIRFGTEITHCRPGTGGMTRSTRCAAVCAIQRPLQEGQTPRPLHEKATTKPCPHDVQGALPNLAHAPAGATGSNCSHAPRDLRFAARDSSLHLE